MGLNSHKTPICGKPDWHNVPEIRIKTELIAQMSVLLGRFRMFCLDKLLTSHYLDVILRNKS